MENEIEFTLIDSDKKLIEFRKYLDSEQIEEISMDFEGEFNLHCYGEKLCLIQIFDGRKFFIIDPFKISISELKKILESKIIKLFFDASSDRMLVYRQYGIQLKSILDLKHYVCTLEYKKTGLNNVLENELNIHIVKKYQKYNWMKRPVENSAMQYALEDVKFLFQLREKLYNRILHEDKGPVLISNIIKDDIDYTKKSTPSITKKIQYRKLSAEQKKIADAIYQVRDVTARKLDWPPNNVLSNDNLFKIAEGGYRDSDIPVHIRINKSERDALIDKIKKII